MHTIRQIIRILIQYKTTIGLAGLVVIATLFVILHVLALPVFREITAQQTFDILILIVNNTFYLAYAAVGVAGIGYLLNFLPPIWLPTAEYAVAVFRMFDPVRIGGMAAINDKFETYPAFPYYSRESDHPSSWPSRVFQDRLALGNLYEKLFSKQKFAAKISSAQIRHGVGSTVQVLSSAPSGVDPLTPKIIEGRTLFNFTFGGDPTTLAKEIGSPFADEFIAIEEKRASLREYFPNRIAIIRVHNTSKQDLNDLTIEFAVTGMVYDLKVRAADKDFEETGWQTFEKRIVVAKLLPMYVLDISIWYYYQSVDERMFPDKINFIQELTQGLTIANIAISRGKVRYNHDLLQNINGYEKLYTGDARAKDNYDKELGFLFEERGKKAIAHLKEYDRKNPTLKDLTLSQLRLLDMRDEQLSSVWVAFRSKAGRNYTAVHVFENSDGPHILLCSDDRDEADFKMVREELAMILDGKAEADITNRSDDICSQIRVKVRFTKVGIANCFDSLIAKGFTDIGITQLHYQTA